MFGAALGDSESGCKSEAMILHPLDLRSNRPNKDGEIRSHIGLNLGRHLEKPRLNGSSKILK